MSEQPSCWEALKQKIFPEEKGFAVLYGEAGVGKTSFSLTLAKNLKRKSLYVNTEGSPTYERALQIGVPPEVEFSDDWDEWGIMHDIIKVWGSKELLIIDSINSIFRVSASYNIESAFRAFSFICSLLRIISEKAMVLATAQVSLTGEAPSGEEALKHYSTSMVRFSRVGWKMEGSAEINGKFFGTYSIQRGGFEWISCEY